ncbi:MAG: sodium:solute symporter, partial [Flavobacteriales bacterium]|nr:sodium:solute symporter [Flavobacteriales bacterium]
LVHLGFSALLVVVIVIFKEINDDSVIASLFKVAGYTYGPLLGMYAFGLFTKLNVKDNLVPLVAVLSPVIAYVLQLFIPFGFELLIVNGALTFVGLLIIIRN